MGPSGSGKTTLLSLLTHKNDPTVTVKGKVSTKLLRFLQIRLDIMLKNFTILEPLFIKTIFYIKH